MAGLLQDINALANATALHLCFTMLPCSTGTLQRSTGMEHSMIATEQQDFHREDTAQADFTGRSYLAIVLAGLQARLWP